MDLRIKKRDLIYTLIATFIIGFVAHGFCYFNGLLSHDSLLINAIEDYMHQVEIGRFMQPIYISIRGNIVVPPVIGIIQLLFIGLTIYLIFDLLNIKNSLNRILTIGILVTNCTVALSNATYICWSDIFALANLLSVLSIYVYYKGTQNYRYVISVVLMIMSLGLYQSAFQVGVALCMIIAIRRLLINDDYKEVIKEGTKAICFLIASLLLYFVINKLVLVLVDATDSDLYNSVGNASKILSIKAWINGFRESLWMEFLWFTGRATINSKLFFVVNIVLFVVAFIYILKIIRNNKLSKHNIGLIFLLVILAPIGFNIIGILSFGAVHYLMIYSFFLAYVIIIMLIEVLNTPELSKIKVLVYIMMTSLLFSNVVYANTVYMKKYMENDATLALTNRIIYQIESIDGYIPGETEVIYVGDLKNNEILNKARPFFNKFLATGLDESYGLTYYLVIENYIVDYLGYPMNIPDKDYADKIAEKEKIKNMPIYPNKGSIEMIDGVVVVKLG